MQTRLMIRSRILIGFGVLFALMAGLHTAWAAIKLYMKDGTYQLVKSYEARGDRVRYYSIERSTWEEVPLSLVDFDATKRAQQEEKTVEKKELEEAGKIEKERFERPEESGFEVAPGIHLPKDEGVFAFDGARVIRLAQTSGEIVRDKKRLALTLALPAPILKNRQLVVLPGPKAAIRLSAAQPTLFVQFADGAGARVELIPVKATKESRVVEKVETGPLIPGKPSERHDTVPLERTQIAPGLFKLKPSQALAPGEYALGELVQEKLNLDVWDFGVDKSSQK